MFNVISIDVTQEDLIEGLFEDNKENREYIEENFENIIESEIEMLEQYVNDSNNSIETLKTIRDNRGELTVTNDDGEEISSCGYYAEIKL